MNFAFRYLHLQIVLLIGGIAVSAVPLWGQVGIRRPDNPASEVSSGRGGMVVSQTPLASEVGRDILAQGGNAVDAAIATAFALAVTWPEAGNIAGGGFMMVAPLDDDVVCVEYRETAPASANETSFVDWKNRRHPRMAGVPGTVRGMQLAHQQYGQLPWKRLVTPAVGLAREGIVVDEQLAYSLNAAIRNKSLQPEGPQKEFLRIFGRTEGDLWTAGDRLVQQDLANTLEQIATDGAGAFYSGSIAEKLVNSMNKHDGLITAEDLQNYKAHVRPAVSAEVAGHIIYGAPLPSSGGITVIMQLRMLEQLGLEKTPDSIWSVNQVHLMSEAMRRAFRERAAWLGDADYVTIPDKVYSRAFARELAGTIDRQQATSSESLAGDIPLTKGPYESPETTHFSVIDKNGMAVSNTYTLEARYGCCFIPEGTGMVLNNEMGDFNWYPGYTNLSGRIGTPANRIAPGKRMLSSQSPVIVKQDGKVRYLVGSPGGRTIINTVTEILVQMLYLDRSLVEAVDAPRFHHQWFPDEIKIEDDDRLNVLVPQLEKSGHHVSQPAGWSQGSAQCIAVDPETGMATGVSDRRRGGGVRTVQPGRKLVP